MTPTIERRYYTQRELSALLGVGMKTLQYWRRAGKLRFIRLGHRTIRIPGVEVQRLAAGRCIACRGGNHLACDGGACRCTCSAELDVKRGGNRC